MADSFAEIYDNLNSTVTDLYDTLYGMADQLSIRTNLVFLKKKYVTNSGNTKFLNKLLVCTLPHENKIVEKDKKYFEEFILSQITVEDRVLKEVKNFISRLTEDEMDILWTYAENFRVLSRRFRKLRNSAWLNEQCIEHIVKITENFDGVSIKKVGQKYEVGKATLVRKNGTYWLGEHDLGLSLVDLEKFESELRDFLV